MTYEEAEAEAFAIVFLKGAASVGDIMNEASMSKEETMKGINSLVQKGLLAMVDDGIEYTANEYGDCIAVGRNPPLWGLTPAAKKTAAYKLMVEAQAHFSETAENGRRTRINKIDTVKWLNNLKNDIGDARHSDLWHYAEAIDDAISVLSECEEIVHCKECRYRSSYGECCRFDDWNPHEMGDRDYCSWGLEK